MAALDGREWCRVYPNSFAERFEKMFASYQDAKHCICTSNGTVSLQLALRACGVRAGDEVIVPALTFIATASAVTEIGAIPVIVDIDGQTGDISPQAIEAAITSKTKAVMGVHYGGYPIDFDRILPICRKHGLSLIEDCAHAHGTEWKGQKVGAIGQFGSFSFQGAKSLTCGEGGAVLTNDEKLAEKANLIHNIGRVLGQPGYMHFVLSSNYRLSELNAAVLISQFKSLPEQVQKRDENHRWLRQEFRKIGGLEPMKDDDRITKRGFYFMVLKYQAEHFKGISREKFMQAIGAEGISFGIGYGMPINRYPAFAPAAIREVLPEILGPLPDYQNLNLPVAEDFCRRQLVFRHPWLLLDKKDLELVVEAVRKVKDNADELKE